MSKETKYSIRDLKSQFPTDEACLSFIFDTLHTRKCSCEGTYKQVKGRRQFQCSKCRFQIAPASGTIFHKSDTPLTSWFHAIFIFSNAKSGISAKEMERQLGVTYKCAWRILSLIRQALTQSDEKLEGDVEIDLTYIGGLSKGHKNRPEAFAKKSVIVSAIERGGKMKSEVLEGTGSGYLRVFMKRHIHPKARIITDGARSFGKEYRRKSVIHSKGEYAQGKFHINTVEAWFGHLKRSITGSYKVISKEHLQSYLDAFVFLRNNRHNDRDRFGILLGVLLHA